MGEGATGDAQDAANEVIDTAQKLADQAMALGKNATHEILDALFAAEQKIVDVQRQLAASLFGTKE